LDAEIESTGSSDDVAVFRYPRVTACASGFFGLVLVFGPLFSTGGPGRPSAAVFPMLLACLAFSGAIYFWRYRVIVSQTTITFGAFQPESIALADVVRIDVSGGRNVTVDVYLRDDRCVRFSSLLVDWAGLIDLIRDRTATGTRIEGATAFSTAVQGSWIIALVWLIVAGSIVLLGWLGF